MCERSRAAIVQRGLLFDEHHFLVIAAVVVHDGQQRDAMMRGGPQHAGRVVQIAVGLDVDGQAAMLAIRQRRAHRGRCAVAHAARALPADVLIMLVELPQAVRPIADEALPGNQRPVFVLDQRPQLGGQARQADGAGIPAVLRLLDLLVPGLLVRLGQLRAALLEARVCDRG